MGVSTLLNISDPYHEHKSVITLHKIKKSMFARTNGVMDANVELTQEDKKAIIEFLGGTLVEEEEQDE
jgi:hypothetical protein